MQCILYILHTPFPLFFPGSQTGLKLHTFHLNGVNHFFFNGPRSVHRRAVMLKQETTYILCVLIFLVKGT